MMGIFRRTESRNNNRYGLMGFSGDKGGPESVQVERVGGVSETELNTKKGKIGNQ